MLRDSLQPLLAIGPGDLMRASLFGHNGVLMLRQPGQAPDHVGSLVAMYAAAPPPPRAPPPGRIQSFGDIRLAAPAPAMHVCIAGEPGPALPHRTHLGPPPNPESQFHFSSAGVTGLCLAEGAPWGTCSAPWPSCKESSSTRTYPPCASPSAPWHYDMGWGLDGRFRRGGTPGALQ